MSEQEFVTTRQAAEVIGVSYTTIQRMVEQGLLKAWKTTGGHRRISRASLNAYITGKASRKLRSQLLVYHVEKQEEKRQQLAQMLEAWKLPLQVRAFNDGISALVAIGQERPDVLIIDLLMPGVSAFDLLQLLQQPEHPLEGIDIVLTSDMDNDMVQQWASLPANVVFYGYPLPQQQMQGYFQAKAQML
ncbi:excisionase family DNA-binding protein [Vogesella sp. LIG4]|uniref:excisionase family DNA-binding protein n=1 Tax=Vogesella sp. LIG4 TaxID=1192162 RepID=UPI00081F9C10|nr:excisionase family DNA-binding protein [Vogesella sp. LIG4]SCK19995.1 DNA binding domain-containing protein, excisionase family [Vogesella sp. LIG4]